MTWIGRNTRLWRLGMLIALVLAYLGPWSCHYDGRTCLPETVNFRFGCCTELQSAWRLFQQIVVSFPNLCFGPQSLSEPLIWLGCGFGAIVVLIYILPLVSLIVALTRTNRQFAQFHFVVWCLPFPGWLVSVVTTPLHPSFWGIWLFNILIALGLILEGALMNTRFRPSA